MGNSLSVRSDGPDAPFRFSRRLDFDGGYVLNEIFKVRSPFQGTSVAKDVLVGQASLYEQIGLFDEMRVHANIDVGGYAWAKYGYVPEPNSWPSLQRTISSRAQYISPLEDGVAIQKLAQSSDPKTLWAVADSPHGKDVLLNSDWDGRLSFRDPEAMSRFRVYLGGNR